MAAMSPETASAITAVERLDARLRDRKASVDEWDRAYLGEHRLDFLSRDFAEHVARQYEGFSDNWCAIVADAPSERTDVAGIELPETVETSDPSAEDRLWDHWLRNGCDEQASQGFLETFIAGRSHVLVWPDPDGSPLISWEHPGQTIVAYDAEHRTRRTAALKRWKDEDGRQCATLYQPDAVWKFEQGGNGWRPRARIDDWVIPNPLGVVPMIEMPNRPRLGAEPVSEVAAALAIQKAINLLWAHLFNASDFASLPQRVIMGVEAPTVPILDEDGRIVGQRPANSDELARIKRDRIMWIRGENPQIGSWPVADLEAYTKVVELLVGHLAAQTRTPANYLIGSMSNVSPETVLSLEVGLVQKVRQAQVHLDRPVREVFALAALIDGDPGLADAARLGSVRWRNPEVRSDAQKVDAAMKLSAIPGMPRSVIADMLELPDEPRAEFLAADVPDEAPTDAPSAMDGESDNSAMEALSNDAGD